MSDPATALPASDTGDGPVTIQHTEHGIAVVEFVQSKVLDEANISEIGARVNGVIAAEPKPRVLLDFKSVDHLSSAALGMLINANNRIREKNGQLRLCDIRRQILEVFSITKLDKLLRIYPDRQAALASFDKPRTDV
jgi:anti-sigma B factor antagonist